MVEVTHADREAAAQIIKSGAPGLGNGNTVIANEVKGGLHDGYLIVQAFAAHRIAERERCAALCVPVATCNGVGERAIGRVVGEAIAQAIRSGE